MEAKDYSIPLGVLRKHPETKRGNRSIKVIQRYLFKHLRKKPEQVKIEPEVNQKLWARGKYAVPKRIEVSVLDEAQSVRVFLKDSKALRARVELQKEKKKPKKEKKKEEKKPEEAEKEEEKEEKTEEALQKEREQEKIEKKIKKSAEAAALKQK